MAAATWNTTNGEWFTAVNWDLVPPGVNAVPGAADDASIPNNGVAGTPFTVTYNGTSTINTLAGSIDGILDIQTGLLTLANGGGFNSMRVDVDAGATLAVEGGTLVTTAGTYAGTVDGAGTMAFVLGDFVISAGASFLIDTWILGVSGNGTVSETRLDGNLTYAGAFTLADLSGNSAILDTNGNILTLSGTAALDASIRGAGSVVVTGDATVATGGFATTSVIQGATLRFASGGTGLQHQNTLLGDGSTTGKLRVDAGAAYTIDATTVLGGNTPLNSLIENAGTLGASGAGTIARINGALTNTGVLTAGAGATLVVQGATATLGGSLTGAGGLVIGFGSDATINTASVTVAALALNGGNSGARLTLGVDLTYGGAFSFQNQFDVLDLNGRKLTLNGSTNTMFNNIVDGAGTLRVNGALGIGGSVSFGGPGNTGTAVSIVNAGAITQDGFVSLNGTLSNLSGSTYTIATNSGTISDQGATIVNAGTFAVTAAGTSTVSGDLTNIGAITVASGSTLVLATGSHALGGSLAGAGTLRIGFAADATISTATVSIAALSLAGGNGGARLAFATNLTYAGALTFDGAFDVIDLNGRTVTLSGAANSLLGNNLDGAGTLAVTGALTIGGNIGIGGPGNQGTPVAIVNSGTITQIGSLSLNGSISNSAGAVYKITTAGSINDSGGSFVNAGSLSVLAAGVSDIFVGLTNSGALGIGAGATLILHGASTLGGVVAGAGALAFGTNANTTITASNFAPSLWQLGGGIFAGTTTLGNNLTFAGSFDFDAGSLRLNGKTLTLTGPVDISGGQLLGTNGLVDTFSVTGSSVDLSALGFASWAGVDVVNIQGTAGVDSLTGSSVADVLSGRAGGDALNGGGGGDTASYATAASAIQARLTTGVGTGGDAQGDTYVSIENLIGSNFNDVLVGDDASGNRLEGLDGNDTLLGRIGADVLIGGAGDDLLDGGAQADSMDGGAGSDTVSYAGATTQVEVRLTTGVGSLGHANFDSYGSIENVIGSAFNDTLVGSNAVNNKLDGGDGNDTLIGNSGNDTLTGGLGKDTLLGGANNDAFVFAAAADSAVGVNRDTIFDFEDAGENDSIVLTGFAGVLSFIGSAAFSAANQVRAITSGADVLIQINTTGTTGPESEILLANTTLAQVDASDFFL